MNEQGPEKKDSEPADLEEIKMLVGIATSRLGSREFMNRQFAFVAQLREKYPDWSDRRAYHTLTGSSIQPEREAKAIDEDFPGDDSVVGFLKSLVS